MRLIDEYRQSLKMADAEEVFDLIFYRPVAFMLVKTLVRTRITPNQVTSVSLVTAIAAAVAFSMRGAMLLPGAALFALANVLDCADGQLARLQGNGTLLGRVWDGVADYIATIVIFAALGVAGGDWLFVIGAGVSSAVHAMMFDMHQSAFMARVSNDGDFLKSDMDRFRNEMDVRRKEGRDGFKVFILSIYILYLRVQQQFRVGPADDAQMFRGTSPTMIRLWSFLGPTTNRTALIVCALFGRPDLYLWGVIAAGNGWMAVCHVLQRKANRAAGGA